jgi:aspartate--ammonia ligase
MNSNPNCRRNWCLFHAEEILERLSRSAAQAARNENLVGKVSRRSSSIGIGWTLKDGYPHEMRAADYDDWVTPKPSPRTAVDARLERRHSGMESRHEAPS